MMNKHETTAVCFRAPFFATRAERRRSAGKYQDDRRGGKGARCPAQAPAPARFGDGLDFFGSHPSPPPAGRAPREKFQGEMKVSLGAARRFFFFARVGVEVLPSLGLGANTASVSAPGWGGTRGEEIQPAWKFGNSSSWWARRDETRCILRRPDGQLLLDGEHRRGAKRGASWCCGARHPRFGGALRGAAAHASLLVAILVTLLFVLVPGRFVVFCAEIPPGELQPSMQELLQVSPVRFVRWQPGDALGRARHRGAHAAGVEKRPKCHRWGVPRQAGQRQKAKFSRNLSPRGEEEEPRQYAALFWSGCRPRVHRHRRAGWEP